MTFVAMDIKSKMSRNTLKVTYLLHIPSVLALGDQPIVVGPCQILVGYRIPPNFRVFFQCKIHPFPRPIVTYMNLEFFNLSVLISKGAIVGLQKVWSFISLRVIFSCFLDVTSILVS